jgi:hypothetical protein
MTRGIVRVVVILLVVATLGSLVVRSLAGPLCLSARSASECQPDGAAETQLQVPACSLFCCTGLPGAPQAPTPPALGLAVLLPGLHDLSVCLAPTSPPPKVLAVDRVNVHDTEIDGETMEEMT